MPLPSAQPTPLPTRPRSKPLPAPRCRCLRPSPRPFGLRRHQHDGRAGTDLSCASSSTARCGFLLRGVLFAARPSTIRIPCLRSPLRCKGLEIKPKCIAESDEPHRHENKRTAVRTNELFASPPVTSDVISKTDEPKQLRQAPHRQRPQTSSPRRTSRSSSGKRVIAIVGLGRAE